MFKKIIIYVFTLIFVLSALQITFSAASSVTVPGGTVTSYEELFYALGGSDTSAIKRNDKGDIVAILIFENIELSSPIKITSGEYVIYGAGSTVTASFSDKSFIEISGEETYVIIGNPDGSTTIDTTFDCKEASRGASIITVESGSVLGIYSGTVIKDVICTSSGGAITNKGELLMYGGTMQKCRAVISGGAVYNEGEVVFASGSITECSSDIGGAVYNSGKAIFIGVEIKSCVADKGGAVYNSSEAKFASSVINECKARMGGAIYNDKTCEVLGGNISLCTADENGGAIYNASDLTLSAGTIQNSSAINGGNVYNNGTLTFDNNISITTGKAVRGGNIYNDNLGSITSNGGSVTLGKADFGGGVFNLGEILLQGGNYHANNATVAGKGFLNHGSVSMTKNGYIDPNNDFFVVLSEDNSHALIVLEGWEYNKQIVKLSCGIVSNGAYEYMEKVGDTLLVLNDKSVIVKDRFALFNEQGLLLSQNGKLIKNPNDNSVLFFVIGAVIVFAVLVTLIVCTVRFFDKRRKTNMSEDDYF